MDKKKEQNNKRTSKEDCQKQKTKKSEGELNGNAWRVNENTADSPDS